MQHMYQGYFCLLFQSCLGLVFSLSLSLPVAHTAGMNILGFGNGHDKTVYKTQSHFFWQIINCDCHSRSILLTISQLPQKNTLDSSGPQIPQ